MGVNEGNAESKKKKMEGVASIALLPCGSVSGHFIHLPHSTCFGLQGTAHGTKLLYLENALLLLHNNYLLKTRLVVRTKQLGSLAILHLMLSLLGKELACERECSRGEDYRLIKLNIIDFSTNKQKTVVVECKGHDAARFHNIEHAHGWEKDVVKEVEQKFVENNILISFECESLKADKAAEDHIRQFMPKLAGMDAVVNIGKMIITGLDFDEDDDETEDEHDS